MIVFLRLWWPVILWSGIIFFFSSYPNLNVPKIMKWQHEDKIYHFAEFFVWGLLFLWRSLRLSSFKPGQNPVIERIFLMLFVGTIFACIDEFHQRWIPGRSFDRYDLFADIAGIAISMVFFSLFKKAI